MTRTPSSPARAARPLALALGALLAFAPTDALAKGGKKGGKKKGGAKAGQVELIGVDSVDAVFKQLRKLENTVSSAEKHRRSSHQNVQKVMGLKDASFAKAVEHLKKEAGGKVKVQVQGKTPQLKATDALPPNVVEGIDAINDALKHYVEAIGDVARIPKEATDLVKKSKAMPDKLKAEVMSNPLAVVDAIRGIGTIKDNVKIAKDLPKRSKAIIAGMNADTKLIVTTFGGKWPPI